MSAGTPRSPSPEADWEPSYVGLLWSAGSGRPQLAERVREAIGCHRPDMRIAFDGDSLLLFAESSPALHLYQSEAGSLAILGAVFDRAGKPVAPPGLASSTNNPQAELERVFASYWGAYVAFGFDLQRRASFIARDPSGGIPVHVLDAGGAALVCDALPPWLATAIGRPTPVDRSMLANALAMPLLTTHRSLLRNILLVPAGGILTWQGRSGACHLGWTPASCWKDGSHDPEAMRRSVLAVTEGWGSLYKRVLLELSGGLDSAIVLGALATTGGVEIAAVNVSTRYSGGDERTQARDAAGKWDVELVEFTAREEELEYEPTLSGPQPLQPNMYGLDPLLEAAVAGTVKALGSDVILTGQGGDAVFFQMPTARVAIDLMRADGVRSLFSPVAFDAARRIRRSIWSVQWQMVRDRLRTTKPDRMPIETQLLGEEARALIDPKLADHPWLENMHSVPPAKQTQILTIANSQMFNGPARRRAAADLRHPLLAQPVVEAWLAAPTYVLSTGTQDRALARSLFADLLPPSIARRRGKGETSIYHRRAVVQNLDFLRSHLLEGTLVANGFLNGQRLDELLDEQSLLWRDEGRAIASLASLESWARYWRL